MISRLLSVLLLLLLCACSVQIGDNDANEPANAGTKDQQEQVLAAANSVAGMFNAGRYSESWNLVGPLLKEKTDQQAWASYIGALRAPLGTPGKSEVLGFGFPTKMADAPPGQYGVIAFKTDFANARGVQEKLVFQRVGNEWKLVGYWLSKNFTLLQHGA